MRNLFTRRNIAIVFVFVVLVVGLFIFISLYERTLEPAIVILETDHLNAPVVIGKSVEGRDIEVWTYGKEDARVHLLFVGGIHGGYEWNSVLLAYKFMDYLEENSDAIPILENLKISVIPSANPDGVYNVVGKEGRFTISDLPTTTQVNGTGRFNANDVDLNRNFDCKWKPTSTWKNNIVSAGTETFSEPEARAIRDFVLTNDIGAAIFWHSQSNAVYASQCEKGILPQTLSIMNAYSQASGYEAIESFDSYEISGDAEGWLASINISAITVELKTHETIEWEQNLAGIKALFEYYEKE